MRSVWVLACSVVALASSAFGSVIVPGLEATSLADMNHRSTFLGTHHRRSDGLYGRRSLKLERQHQQQRSHQPVLAMAIPGYGIAEQVFVGGFANFLSIFNLVITGRILLSWFPQAQSIGALQPVFAITDPYLNLFRGIIPPIFGLDLSPILAFVTLNLLTSATASVGCEIPEDFQKNMMKNKKNKFSKMIMKGQANMGLSTN